MAERNKLPDLPQVSILMPVRNEGKFIEHSLAAVLNQDYPLESMEIFVVDGQSKDGTSRVIQGLAAKYPQIHLLDNPRKIVPTGLNLALKHSKGEIVIRVDGHCEIAPDYVRRCVEHLKEGGVDGVGGPLETIGETYLAQTIAIAMSSSFGVGDSTFRTTNDQTLLVDSVPFPAYKRAIIKEAGLFDEELVRNQDDEFNYRLRKLGAKILLAADVRSKYYSRSSLRSLWRQYYQYGFWKIRVLQKHPRQMRPRQFAPPLFVSALILSAILPLLQVFMLSPLSFPSSLIPLYLVTGSYLLANLSASIYTASQKGWKHIPLLPFVYTILHLSYGSGFMVGLVKFWNRWGDKRGKVPQLVVPL